MNVVRLVDGGGGGNLMGDYHAEMDITFIMHKAIELEIIRELIHQIVSW